ncbi:MAG: transketolase [Spirochaetales bacterium]|uniref:Transketolase n=1 Tax=Candidatus Thalassospirochaeta sargassi TaxID=3119039 RepID=A0AAJ1MPE1_9SPIO|nr:transketolase [Spirochaetales bacterium]
MSLTSAEELKLKKKALDLRTNVLRMMKASRAGHVGGAMSSAEILTVLYFHIMNVSPENFKDNNRDRFVLSAGHKCLILYAALAELGFIDYSVLDTYGSMGCLLPGHPNMKIPGVEANTGALGHGLSISGGMAQGLKLNGSDARVFTVMGDGELAEGSNWEAFAAAAHHRLDNLLAFIDWNGLQIGGKTADVMNYSPLTEKLEAFGWSVINIDGHDLNAIVDAVTTASETKGKPTAVIAKTIKSKGLSFAEGKAGYHYWKASDEEIAEAEANLEQQRTELTAMEGGAE